ncbi:DUF3304 domain-containing protein [Salmonella enterica subsp. enterica serovar Florian]|nr:DUF3304 domain-containing protein [Salmonella enterica subsp. enterica serovar Florian]
MVRDIQTIRVRIENYLNMKKAIMGCLLLVFLVISGCSSARGDKGYTAGDLRATNHVKGIGINGFSVNGYHVPGLGGGYCCIMLPDKWTPDLKAHIEWEVDPNPNEYIPMKKKGFGYDEDAYAQHAAKYQRYSLIVNIPQYGSKRCGLTVHFLPCHQVKVTTACEAYGTPTYPIKEPKNMEEPASCPVK